MNQGDTMIERLRALGSFFRFYRREQGLKQEEVAERAGVSKNTISQIERGKQWPSMQTYLRLLESLDLPRYDVTNPLSTESNHRRWQITQEMGLEEWFDSLSDDEIRYAFIRAWEGIELMRELERRGLQHPFNRFEHPSSTALHLLAPHEIGDRIRDALGPVAERMEHRPPG